MNGLDLAVIGNCSFAALIDARARVIWACLPRFDGDPVFCALLSGDAPTDGIFEIELLDLSRVEQRYRRNSAVLESHLYDKHGGAIEVTDFAPRFYQYGRVYRPNMLIRRLARLAGSPRIRMRIRPQFHFGSGRPEVTRGSNHLRFVMPEQTLRLTTDGPVSYMVEELPFILESPIAMLLGPDEMVAAQLADLTRDLQEKTDDYWRNWCHGLSLPFEWQDEVIRAAITLKLCSYDESGAIVAALTTSIPEAADSGRNWDYRFCWLRDASFVVSALNRLNATRTMELYLNYIANVVATAEDGYLQPVFGILREDRLDEREVAALAGYRAMAPVRSGNDAYRQIQNDGYGSVILASTQTFFDRRLDRLGDETSFHRLERLGEQAARRWDQPDSGPWELRTRLSVNTYSGVMCWAACDRLSLIAARLGLDGRRDYWRAHAERIRHGVLAQSWDEGLNSFVANVGGSEVDATLLLMPVLGFVSPADSRFLGTLALIEKRLRVGNFLFRYIDADDFGRPTTAFTACTFWYVDALAMVGRIDEARELFAQLLTRRNSLGLLSEDIDVSSGELWGNFPQTYSMVGLIHSAMRLSRPWEGAF